MVWWNPLSWIGGSGGGSGNQARPFTRATTFSPHPGKIGVGVDVDAAVGVGAGVGEGGLLGSVALHYDPWGLTVTLEGEPRYLDAFERMADLAVRQLHLHLEESGLTLPGAWPTVVRRDARRLEVLTGILALLGARGDLGYGGRGAAVLPLLEGGMRLVPEAWAAGAAGEGEAGGGEGGALRVYQAQAVQAALDAWLGRCILVLPTGAGKTRIAAGIVAAAGGRWLYLVQSKRLVRQTMEEFAQVLPLLGGAAGGVGVDGAGGAGVDCMTYSGAAKWASWGGPGEDCELEGIIIDEVHSVSAATRVEALTTLRARRRVGLSATPLDRLDGGNSWVVGLTGPVVYEVSMEVLEADGYLASGTVERLVISHGRNE